MCFSRTKPWYKAGSSERSAEPKLAGGLGTAQPAGTAIPGFSLYLQALREGSGKASLPGTNQSIPCEEPALSWQHPASSDSARLGAAASIPPGLSHCHCHHLNSPCTGHWQPNALFRFAHLMPPSAFKKPCIREANMAPCARAARLCKEGKQQPSHGICSGDGSRFLLTKG